MTTNQIRRSAHTSVQVLEADIHAWIDAWNTEPRPPVWTKSAEQILERLATSAPNWGFAIYRASHNDYEKSVLPSGHLAGTPREALDCACSLYLSDITAWLDPPPPTD
ncbi:MAG: hypothetical protein ACRDRL_05375 [Sciscionella sp.]